MQFDGMKFREEPEIISLIHELREHGIEHLNFTFYGTRAYHNKFCGRAGVRFSKEDMSFFREHTRKITIGKLTDWLLWILKQRNIKRLL